MTAGNMSQDCKICPARIQETDRVGSPSAGELGPLSSQEVRQQAELENATTTPPLDRWSVGREIGYGILSMHPRAIGATRFESGTRGGNA